MEEEAQTGGREGSRGPDLAPDRQPRKRARRDMITPARSVVKDLMGGEVGKEGIQGISEKLGIPYSEVEGSYKEYVDHTDPFIQNYFLYEKGEAKVSFGNFLVCHNFYTLKI